MPSLKSAAELASASKPYPNDSAEYRTARTALLAEEIELRRHIERVAAQRRALPPGGEAGAYEFRDETGKTVGLTALFGAHDTLVTYFWMYGPERERPCPTCTSFLGSMDIPARDISQRVAFAVIGRSPVERQLAFARERGWTNLKFYATVGDHFARDYAAWPLTATNGLHSMSGSGAMAACDISGEPNSAVPKTPVRIHAARPIRRPYGTSSTSPRQGGGPTGTRSSAAARRGKHAALPRGAPRRLAAGGGRPRSPRRIPLQFTQSR